MSQKDCSFLVLKTFMKVRKVFKPVPSELLGIMLKKCYIYTSDMKNIHVR